MPKPGIIASNTKFAIKISITISIIPPKLIVESVNSMTRTVPNANKLTFSIRVRLAAKFAIADSSLPLQGNVLKNVQPSQTGAQLSVI